MFLFVCFLFLVSVGCQDVTPTQDTFFEDLQKTLVENNVGVIPEGEAIACDYMLSGHISVQCNAAGALNLLSIGDMQMPAIPESIEAVTELNSLNFVNCGLKVISPNVKLLTDLTQLDLSKNQISDFQFLEPLVKIVNLNLANNEISSIPAEILNFENLVNLQLAGNSIKDPSSLKQLTNLEVINLGANPITSISELSALTGLYDLNLSYTPLTFELEPTLVDFKELTQLDVSNTLISGTKPEKITKIACYESCVSFSDCSMNENCDCKVIVEESICLGSCEWSGKKCVNAALSLQTSLLLLIASLAIFLF